MAAAADGIVDGKAGSYPIFKERETEATKREGMTKSSIITF